MPDPRPFRYDQRSHRYRSPSGRYIGWSTVRGLVDDYLASTGREMMALTERLRQGDVTLAEWQTEMMRHIKAVHLAGTASAKGGWNELSKADQLRVAREIKEQYRYLRERAKKIQSGDQRLDGTIINIARQYAEAARHTYHATEREEMIRRGFDEARSVRNARDSCTAGDGRPGCVEEAARGWAPIEAISLPGRRTCRAACKCEIHFKNSLTGEVRE